MEHITPAVVELPHERVDPNFRLAKSLLEADLIGKSPNSMVMQVLQLLYDVAPQYTKAKIQALFRQD
jgi:hypothetical protein